MIDESDNLTGDKIWTISDRYLVMDRLGSGGMAEIFRAKMFGAAGFEKEFTIKLIRRHLLEDAEFVEMFVNEAKLSVALYHTNIVQVFDFGQHDGRYYIVMEYVEGKDLLDILSRCVNLNIRVPMDIALYIVMEMLKGLEFAHKATDVTSGEPLSIIHRDISPSNILISYTGHVKVGDFGVAKARMKNSLSRTGTLKGKVGYLSPEQVVGKTIDQRSDIFSAGIVLFETLSMSRLFRAETDFDTMVKVRDCNIEEALERIHPLPKALRRIVLKALARHPDNRYDSAADFFQDLAAFSYSQRITTDSAGVANFMRRLFSSEIKRQKKKRVAESDNLQWMRPPQAILQVSTPQTAPSLPEIPNLSKYTDSSDDSFPIDSRELVIDKSPETNIPELPHELPPINQRSNYNPSLDRHSSHQTHNSDVEMQEPSLNRTSQRNRQGDEAASATANRISKKDAPVTAELPPTSSTYGRNGAVNRRSLELEFLEKYRGKSFYYRNPEGAVFGPLMPSHLDTFVKGAKQGELSFDGDLWISVAKFIFLDQHEKDNDKTIGVPPPSGLFTKSTPFSNTGLGLSVQSPPIGQSGIGQPAQSGQPTSQTSRLPRLGDRLHSKRIKSPDDLLDDISSLDSPSSDSKHGLSSLSSAQRVTGPHSTVSSSLKPEKAPVNISESGDHTNPIPPNAAARTGYNLVSTSQIEKPEQPVGTPQQPLEKPQQPAGEQQQSGDKVSIHRNQGTAAFRTTATGNPPEDQPKSGIKSDPSEDHKTVANPDPNSVTLDSRQKARETVSRILRHTKQLQDPSSGIIHGVEISEAQRPLELDIEKLSTLAELSSDNEDIDDPDRTVPPSFLKRAYSPSSGRISSDPSIIPATSIPVRAVGYSTRQKAHQGSFDQVSFTRILHRIYHSQETGRLALTNDGIEKEAFFELGRPVAINSNLPHERLGDLLLERQLITQEQLDTALSRIEKWGGRVGDALVANGAIPAYQIVDHLKMQFEGKLLEVFSWHTGSYRYFENQVTDERIYSIGIDLPRLIARGCFDHIPRRVILQNFEDRGNEAITLKSSNNFGIDTFMLSTRAVRIMRMVSTGDTIDALKLKVPPADHDLLYRVLYLLHQVEFLSFETTKQFDSPGFSFKKSDD